MIAEALSKGAVQLPAIPRIAQQVMASAQDPGRGAADVAKLIERDPALCARLIRAANSARYGGAAAIVSARQAVVRVGMAEVASLAMSAAVRGALIEKGPFETPLTHWWHRSLKIALYAKEIARRRRQSVDSAFLCGLLCDVGVPVVLRMLAAAEAALSRDEISELVDRFRTKAGLALCNSWNLSDTVHAAVAEVRCDAPPTMFIDHVHTVRLATVLAECLPVPEDAEAPSALSECPSTVALNLYPEDIEHLVGLASTVESLVGALK